MNATLVDTSRQEPLNVICEAIIRQAGGVLRLSEADHLFRTINVFEGSTTSYEVVLRTASTKSQAIRMIDDLHVRLNAWGELVDGSNTVGQGRRSVDEVDLVLLQSWMKEGLSTVLAAGADAIGSSKAHVPFVPTRVATTPVELGELREIVCTLLGSQSSQENGPFTAQQQLWDYRFEGHHWRVLLERLKMGDLYVSTAENIGKSDSGEFVAGNNLNAVLFTPGAFGGATVLDHSKTDFLGPWDNSRRPTVEEVLRLTECVQRARNFGTKLE